jgi:hypothetical protein
MPCASPEELHIEIERGEEHRPVKEVVNGWTKREDRHVIVVFTRPTFAKSDILAKSVANSGVSCIFSRSALEHRGELISA